MAPRQILDTLRPEDPSRVYSMIHKNDDHRREGSIRRQPEDLPQQSEREGSPEDAARAFRCSLRSLRERVYFTSRSSTSNTSVAFGGIIPPAPRGPYASADGITSVREPPTFMPATP